MGPKIYVYAWEREESGILKAGMMPIGAGLANCGKLHLRHLVHRLSITSQQQGLHQSLEACLRTILTLRELNVC